MPGFGRTLAAFVPPPSADGSAVTLLERNGGPVAGEWVPPWRADLVHGGT
ncbi:hypothetical protein GCM10029964_127050 [Kibdelosporangium lantanae]